MEETAVLDKKPGSFTIDAYLKKQYGPDPSSESRLIVHVENKINKVRCLEHIADMADDGIKNIYLDLSKADGLRASGLGYLVEKYKECAAKGIGLHILNPHENAIQLLMITNLANQFGIAEENYGSATSKY